MPFNETLNANDNPFPFGFHYTDSNTKMMVYNNIKFIFQVDKTFDPPSEVLFTVKISLPKVTEVLPLSIKHNFIQHS